jgi:endonuclease/exonuclease/phosphatase (EEP) superfamily protein YafD
MPDGLRVLLARQEDGLPPLSWDNEAGDGAVQRPGCRSVFGAWEEREVVRHIARPLTMVSINRFTDWLSADSELCEARQELRQAQRFGDTKSWMLDRVRRAEESEKESRRAHDAVSKFTISDIMKKATKGKKTT